MSWHVMVVAVGVCVSVAIELGLLLRNAATKRALAQMAFELEMEAASLLEMRRTIAMGKEIADLMDRLERHGRPEDIRRLRRAAAKLMPS